jgi:N-methylhydantoinase B
MTGGGGGWGDPLTRDPDWVLADVKSGLVSIDRAAADYGIVVDPLRLVVDQTASDQLRATARREEPDLARRQGAVADAGR